MLQQGAMALTSFHGKLSRPLKHGVSLLCPSLAFLVLRVLSHCLGLLLVGAFAIVTHFPHVYVQVDVFISN